MPATALILVETSLPGNLGAAIRVAANFGVAAIELVRPAVDPDHPEVVAWACGGHDRLAIRRHETLDAAAAPYRVLIGSASARGRAGQHVVTPDGAAAQLGVRPDAPAALVFGNETRGLRRRDIDRCDLVVRVPTVPEFPVLNLAQAVAILLASMAVQPRPPARPAPRPASQERVAGLMEHLRSTLLTVGFLDPASPDRILRKLRRLFGRAGITDNEVAILRGICRQVDWAARRRRTAGGKG